MPTMPITYKEFFKNPIIGILFLSLFAISYLYFDNKNNYKDIIDKQENKIEALELKVDNLEKIVRSRDSILFTITSKVSETQHRWSEDKK